MITPDLVDPKIGIDNAFLKFFDFYVSCVNGDEDKCAN